MKKKLEAELISIAHRILQLKNKSDLLQLHKEAQILYEKLSLLKFVEENFADAKPTIGYAEIETQIETAFGKEAQPEAPKVDDAKERPSGKEEKADADTASEATEPKAETEEDKGETTPETPEAKTSSEPTPEPEDDNEKKDDVKPEGEAEIQETVSETELPKTPEQPESVEEVQAATAYENAGSTETEMPSAEDAGVSEAGEIAPAAEDLMPSFEFAFDKKEDAKDAPKEQKQIAFEDFLGHDYNESFFVKAGEANQQKEETPKEETPVEEAQQEAEEPQANEAAIHVNEAEIVAEKQPEEEERAEYRPLPTNDYLSKSITIGLNDRIGFEKQLFGGSSEDLNRVLSQLNTFNSFQEAQDFIEDMVKPDYNNWEGKDDYAQRFMDVVEKKFS